MHPMVSLSRVQRCRLILGPGQGFTSHLQLIQDPNKLHVTEGKSAQGPERKQTGQLRFIPALQGVDWDPS